MSDGFADILWARVDGPARSWLERAWPAGDEGLTSVRFRATFAGLGRRLREYQLGDEDTRSLADAGVIGAGGWGIDAIARTALLLRALEILSADRHGDFVRQVYLRGDYREQTAVLRSLPFLPEPVRFLDLAIEACRTNVLDVFEGIACENPYPAAHFPKANFNQLVLKAIFMEVAVGRVAGLDGRVTVELQRMATDFADERRAASRAVPGDVDFIVNLAAS